MATITWTCTRCTKETQDPFIWEHMTAKDGEIKIYFCSKCKDWALMLLLTEYPNEIVDIVKKANESRKQILFKNA